MKLKDKNILITGAHGFVGSHLTESLLKENTHIVGLFQTMDPKSYFYQKGLQDKITMIQADINNFEKIFAIITKFNIDYIFHLAAQPIVDVAYHNPKETLQTNIMGTVNILESARLFENVKGVLIASSDKAYGKLIKKKYKETDALRGNHPYEVSKSAADLISSSYYKTYGVPVVITRFGNIYGEGDLNFSRIIPSIMKAVTTRTTLKLRSDGTYTRDYLNVKDVVRGYILCAENLKNIRGEAFNFGSDETFSVLQLIKIAESTLGVNIKYEIMDTARNEIRHQSLDYKKAVKILRWKPKHSLEKTLPSIAAYYKSIT